MPRFRLSAILCVTTFAAFALLSLVKPSQVWLTVWPLVISGMSIFIFSRLIPLNRQIAFWVSIVVGVLSFMAATVFVMFVAVTVRIDGPNQEIQWLPRFVYTAMYGDPRLYPTTNDLDYLSFAVSVQTILAILWSAIVASLVQFVFRERDKS